MPKKNSPYEDLLSAAIRDNKIAAEIQSRYPEIRELANATSQDLSELPGVGPIKAKQILACVEIGKLLVSPKLTPMTSIKMPADVNSLLGPEMRLLEKEEFRVLLLNTKNHVLAMNTVSVGTANASLAVPREIFKAAVRAKTVTAIILVHNHPSGDPEPSPEDLAITKRIVESGKIIGIDVLDHVVIGENSYVSFKEKCLL